MKIYVGTDGSDGAAAAVRWAGALAASSGSPLHVVHALEYGQAEVSPEFAEEKRSEVQARLDADWSAPARSAGAMDVTTELISGHPEDVLLDLDAGDALVVVGSRGAGGFDDLGAGSTAHRLAHHTSRPLAVVPASAHAPSGPVVVGADGSKANEDALACSADLASEIGSGRQVVLVHDAAADSYPHPDLDNWKYHGQKAVEKQLAAAGASADLVVNTGGNAVKELQRVADESDASCIVVGTHGHGHLRRHLLGRVPSQLLAHPTSVPVVIAPHQRDR